MQEQQFRVPVSLAKRGKENSQDIQAVHQITAEQFFAGKLIDAFVGGGNNADIDGDDLVTVSYTHLDVYKRQLFRGRKRSMPVIR